MLDVRRLQVLLAVHEHGGVAAAARALAFTPPAVSQQLAALERQLDVGLVDRTGRTAVLTAAGRRLADHARRVLAGLEAAEADVAGWRGDVRGVVRVGSVPTLARALLPRALTRLSEEAPAVDVRIQEDEPEHSIPALVRGEVDLVLAGEYSLTPHRARSTWERIDLFTEPVHVAVPRDHPSAGAQVRLDALRDDRWIAPLAGSACDVLLERSCAVAGYEPHVVGRCGDFAAAAALVAVGRGVALLPAITVAPLLPETGGLSDSARVDLVGSPRDGFVGGARDVTGSRVRLLTVTDPGISRTLYAGVRQGTRSNPPLAALLDAVFVAATDLAGAAETP